MAEIVEYRVERTLDELNLLVEFGIFTQNEAKEIVAKRERFEYTLRRKTKSKLDYLKYIRFETNLLESIEKYKKRIISDYYNSKKSSDTVEEIERKILLLQAKKLNDIIRSRSTHISSLFRKLTIKFQFDKKLWLAYIEFAKTRNWNNRVTALYWRLLRVAGDDQSIWLQAAAHEVEVNKTYDIARGLYLKALRHHPKCPKVWVEYFKMELKYMEVIDKRARIVFKTLESVDDKNTQKSGEEDIWADTSSELKEEEPTQNEDLDKASDNEPSKNEDTEDNEKNKPPVVKPLDEDDAILLGRLPKLVYDNALIALDSISESNDFITNVMQSILTSNEETKGLISVKEHIMQDLEHRNSSNDPRVSKDLLNACNTAESLEAYLRDKNLSKSFKRIKKHERSKLDHLYECYEASGIESTRSMFSTYEKSVKNQTLSLYVGMIQVELWELKKDNSPESIDRIRSIYDKALMKFGKTKPKLWYEYLQFEHIHAKNLTDLDRINHLYQRALATLEASKVDKFLEKYTLIRVNSSATDIEYSDYSDLED